jgi:hypothetical protein
MAADSGIKKAKVVVAELPAISSETEGYSLRYRIISEDKNRVSHWSPLYLLKPEYTFVPGSIKFSSTIPEEVELSKVINISWDSVTILKDTATIQQINNKALSTKVATLTTSGAHYMKVGDWVTVSGVDSTFNGTYELVAVTSNTFSYYKDNVNISSTAVSPLGTYKRNSLIQKAKEYDIWVRLDRNDGGDWIYKQRIDGTSISLPQKSIYTINGVVQASAPNKISIEIFLKGYPITRGDGVPLATGTPFLKVYRLLNVTI